MATRLLMVLATALALSWCASAPAQVANDNCATAIPITATVTGATNVGATLGPDPVPTCPTMTGDVWYSWVAPCNGAYTASTCGGSTNFSTIVAVWTGACGGLTQVGCSDVCVSGALQGASVTFMAIVGTAYRISVGGNSGATGTFDLSLTLGAGMSLGFFHGGPGSMGYFITEGPTVGTAFVAITLTAGQFPAGWFLGLDIAWIDLLNELTIGYPFVLPLQLCGNAQVGPVTGLPSGLQVFAVALALPPGGTIPTATTLPVVGVVQ
jgi:hypothetical protein